MDKMMFEFSDLISGYVITSQTGNKQFTMKTSDEREFTVILGANLSALMLRNLGDPWLDCTGQINELLVKDQMVFAYGIFYPQADDHVFEAKMLYFPGKKVDKYRFEEQSWWIQQTKNISDFFIQSQFGKGEPIDYTNYRTDLELTGEHKHDYIQETDTISRLVYGFASTYLLTGEDIYLEAAEKGTAYLREHMRFYDIDENLIYWYHGINVKDGKEYKLFASEFSDDDNAIPCYEQIYALAGPVQTYRVNGDPKILKDARMTVELFQNYYLDREKGGYFSHLDPVTLNPRAEILGKNQGRKNWNSVGDHAPAYLINLCLATNDEEYKKMLKYCADLICEHFPDYDNSPFVQEKFFEDWSHDEHWSWQQNRGLAGHNLKIAWNLMRIHSLFPDEKYRQLAEKIARLMPTVGLDKQRFGVYDVMERKEFAGETFHRFAWHDRKAWWQQEQGILAYQILYGILGDEFYLKHARELAAFYNSFFLDYDNGAVYFNVLNNGLPYLLGTERQKGSHSMSGYHSMELCYLSQTYINLLHTKQSLDLYFKPMIDAFPDNKLYAAPDFLPPKSIKIKSVTVDGQAWKNFDAENLIIDLPNIDHRPKIRVTIVPV